MSELIWYAVFLIAPIAFTAFLSVRARDRRWHRLIRAEILRGVSEETLSELLPAHDELRQRLQRGEDFRRALELEEQTRR